MGRRELSRLCIIFLCTFLLLPVTSANDVVSERFTRYYDRLAAGSNTVFVDVEDISIVRLTLVNDAIAFNVRVYLSTFSYNPAGLPLIDDVYQYHNLLVTNLDASAVSEATMEFRVSKEWLLANGKSADVVRLYQLVDGSWVEQNVESINEDIGYYYYRAPFSSFGYYVITVTSNEVVAATPVVEEIPEVKEVIEEPEVTIEEETPVNVEEESSEVIVYAEDTREFPIMVVVIIVLLLAGGGGYIAYRVKSNKDAGGMSGFFKEADPGNYLRLKDTSVIKNIYDLDEVLATISNEVFAHHVHDEVNDFAQWVSTALHEEDCGMKLKLAPCLAAHQQIIREFILDREGSHTKTILQKKYALSSSKAEELVALVRTSQQQGKNSRFIFDTLISQHNDRNVAYDLAYGMVDTIEDVVMHPEDEALIDRVIYNAAQKKEDYITIKLNLLDAGWPRFVVEKKMEKHFRSVA